MPPRGLRDDHLGSEKTHLWRVLVRHVDPDMFSGTRRRMKAAEIAWIECIPMVEDPTIPGDQKMQTSPARAVRRGDVVVRLFWVPKTVKIEHAL